MFSRIIKVTQVNGSFKNYFGSTICILCHSLCYSLSFLNLPFFLLPFCFWTHSLLLESFFLLDIPNLLNLLCLFNDLSIKGLVLDASNYLVAPQLLQGCPVLLDKNQSSDISWTCSDSSVLPLQTGLSSTLDFSVISFLPSDVSQPRALLFFQWDNLSLHQIPSLINCTGLLLRWRVWSSR